MEEKIHFSQSKEGNAQQYKVGTTTMMMCSLPFYQPQKSCLECFYSSELYDSIQALSLGQKLPNFLTLQKTLLPAGIGDLGVDCR